MAPLFTLRFLQKIPTNISLSNAKCVFHNSQIFVLLPQSDTAAVPIYSYNPDSEKWVEVDVKNASLLNTDADNNIGEDYDLECKVKCQYGLQVYVGFTNGSSARYALNIETLQWCRLPRPPRQIPVCAQLDISDVKYRIVSPSRSDLSLQILNDDKIVTENALIGMTPKHNTWKFVNVGGKAYLLRLDFQEKTRSIMSVDNNGMVVVLSTEKYTRDKCKTEIWSKNGNVFFFQYGHELKLEYFDIQASKWNTINVKCKSYLRDVISFHRYMDRLIIVFRSLKTSDFSSSNTIGVVYFELASTLLTTTLVHCSTQILEKKLDIDQVASSLPRDKLNSFNNIHALQIDQIIAREKYEMKKLERARERLLARRNSRGFIN